MLEISGSTRRSYSVPGARPDVYAFYSTLPRIVAYLPHIRLVAADPEDAEQFRVAYETLELGTYAVCIVCDLKVTADPDYHLLHIGPALRTPFPDVVASVGMRSATGQGVFQIESRFYDAEDGRTRVEYALTLASRLPKPSGLRLMPGHLMETIVERVARGRLEEIVDHFVRESVAAFTPWNAGRAET